ncbi:MAG: DUF1949 domain-containing protein, partial [Betaproteobacteria bacterium]|nr:DUF1949 domain-containing protein [Betaproteobacteria bacterium]
LEHESFDAEGATLALALPAGQIAALEKLLADVSRGRSTLQLKDDPQIL